MLSAIMTFQYAHLERGDAEVSVQSSAAWQGFAWTLGILIVLAITVPQIVGSSWSFRLRQDGFYGCKSRRGGVGGDSNCGGGDSRCESCWCWICRCASRCFRQVTAKHRPVRFDIHNIAAQAEEVFNQIDIDGNGSLSEKELTNADGLSQVIEQGNKKRAVAATLMNSESSRSHAVVIIRLEQEHPADPAKGKGKKKINSKVNLVIFTGHAGARLVVGCSFSIRTLQTSVRFL